MVQAYQLRTNPDGNHHPVLAGDRAARLPAWYVRLTVLGAFVLCALLPTQRAFAQSESVTYGFVRDPNDSMRIIAAAWPNPDFTGDTFSLTQGAVFSFYLPAGTIAESTPLTVQSDLAFTPLNDTAWTVEVFTDSLMDSLTLDTANRDLYHFSLANSPIGRSAATPFPLFSFTLPNEGCNGGSVETLANGDAFSTALLADQQIQVNNFFSAIIEPAMNGIDLYAGADLTTGVIPCVETPLAVTLAFFNAQTEGDTVRFTWQTATENGNAGFNLWADSPATQLNAALIPSKVIDAVTPTDYAFHAVTAANRFYLEEVSIDGKTVRNGPYQLGESYGDYVAVPSTDPDRGDGEWPAMINAGPTIYLPLVNR